MTGGWQLKQLSEVCAIDKIQGFHAGLPYVGLENIEPHTARFVGDLNAKSIKSATFRFSRDHVLYGRLRPYLNKVAAPDFSGHCSTEIFPLKPKPSLQREFLVYWLISQETVSRIDATCTGARMPRANMNEVMEFELPIPPIPEQRRIVGILDEAFAGLEAMRANAEKNLQNARALFDKELEDIFTNTLAHAPRKTLAEIALEIGRGKSRHRPRGDPKLLGGRYPFIQTGEVANAIHVIESYSQTYNELGLAQSKLWSKNTVCIAIVGANVAETAILGFDACFPDSIIGFIANPKHADVDYVQYLLRAFKSVLKEKGKGTARDNINMGTFESERFPMPSLSEQSSIALRLSSLSGETQLLEDVYLRKLAAIDELKKSLLHNAFSGNL